MKRIVSFLLVCVLLTGCLCGCTSGKKTVSAEDAKKIVIWHDKEEEVINILEDKLKELEPDVQVTFEKKSDLTESLKMVGKNPSAAPDMYIFAHDKMGVYVEMDLLEPITNIIPEEELAGYLEPTKEAATYKGNMYQLPIYYETLLFMYNRKYMKDEEVPKTTEELFTYMQNNTNGGHYGFVEQHSTPYYAAGWINGFGGTLLTEDGKANLDSPEVKGALEYHKKFVELMPGETEYATVNTLFNEEMAHSTIAGPWLIPTVKDSGMDVGVAPMPVIDSQNSPIAPYMGVQGVQVLKYAAENKKDSVEKVLRALMNPELEVQLAKASGCAPALEACYDFDEVKNDEIVMAMKQTAETAVPMPNLPEMDVMWTVVGNLLTDVNMSGKDIDESVSEAQESAESLIANMQ